MTVLHPLLKLALAFTGRADDPSIPKLLRAMGPKQQHEASLNLIRLAGEDTKRLGYHTRKKAKQASDTEQKDKPQTAGQTVWARVKDEVAHGASRGLMGGALWSAYKEHQNPNLDGWRGHLGRTGFRAAVGGLMGAGLGVGLGLYDRRRGQKEKEKGTKQASATKQKGKPQTAGQAAWAGARDNAAFGGAAGLLSGALFAAYNEHRDPDMEDWRGHLDRMGVRAAVGGLTGASLGAGFSLYDHRQAQKEKKKQR